MICSADQTSIPQLWDHKHTSPYQAVIFLAVTAGLTEPVTDRLEKIGHIPIHTLHWL